MTTTQRRGILSGFDPRALPMAVKIALGGGVVLLVSMLVTGYLMQQIVTDAQVEVTLSDLESFSHTQALRVVDALDQEVTVLSHMGSSMAVQQQLRMYHEQEPVEGETALIPDNILSQQVFVFREIYSEFDSIVLLDANGYILAIDPAPAENADLAVPGGWTWFSSAYNNGAGATYLFNPEDDHLTGHTGTHIAVPIYDAQNPDEVIGVLYGVWNMNNVLDIVRIGGTQQGLVLEPDGTILVSPVDVRGASVPSSLVRRLREGHAGADHPHVQQTGGSFIYTREGEQAWLYGYTTLGNLDLSDEAITRLGWTIVTRQPLSSAQARASAVLNRLFLTLGGGIALVILVILVFTRSLLVPLHRLTEAAARIEAGDLDAPIPQLPGDEIGQLSGVLNNLVKQLLHRVQQLRAAVETSRTAALTLDTNQMLAGVARIMTQQFQYPEVRLYLTDVGHRFARLQAASGKASEHMLNTGQRLEIDETTLVGRSILLNEIQFGDIQASLQDTDPVVRHSELAIPLQAGGHPLGALYVLTGHNRPFAQEDIDILRLLADQIGASIENARLFEQSASNLAEIEALNRLLTRDVWQTRVRDEELRHTLDPDQRWPETPVSFRESRAIKVEMYADADGRSVLAAPLILRGETIGTLAVTRPPGETWSHDEAVLLETVASRMVMVAEGLRLVEESTQLASRERQVNEISASLLQRAATVDDVLQSALSQLGGAISSDHLSLRIGPPPIEGDRRITSGNTRTRSEADASDNITDRSGKQSGSTANPDLPGAKGDGDLDDDQ